MTLIRTVVATLLVLGIAGASAAAADHEPAAGPASPAAPGHAAPSHAGPAPAAPAHAAPAPDGAAHAQPGHAGAALASAPGPAISADAQWSGSLLIIAGALFLAAAVIGPVYRATLPEEIPDTHAHDEPPGTSGHHDHGHGHSHGGHH